MISNVGSGDSEDQPIVCVDGDVVHVFGSVKVLVSEEAQAYVRDALTTDRTWHIFGPCIDLDYEVDEHLESLTD